jgi:hypothetical protein
MAPSLALLKTTTGNLQENSTVENGTLPAGAGVDAGMVRAALATRPGDAAVGLVMPA